MAYWYPVDKLTLLMLRMGFSLPFYIFIAFQESAKKNDTAIFNHFTKKDFYTLLFLGIIGYYFASFLDIWGLKYVSAGMERLILFVYPTITTLLVAFVFNRRVTKTQILAIILTYLGIGLAFWNKIEFETSSSFIFGSLLIFGSAVTFSVYLVGSEKFIPKLGAKRFTSYSMIISCLATVIHFLFAGDIHQIFNLKWEVYAIAICIAVFSTVLPSFMMSYVIEKIGASSTSIISSIGPIWVLILAYFVLGESFNTIQIAGTLIVILGIGLITQKKKLNEIDRKK